MKKQINNEQEREQKWDKWKTKKVRSENEKKNRMGYQMNDEQGKALGRKSKGMMTKIL